MSNINKAQGAVKAKEVLMVNPQEVINTVTNQDLMDSTSRLAKVNEDAFRRHQCFALSSGELTWDAPQLKVPSTTLVEFLILINSSNAASRSVRCQYQAGSLTTWDITSSSFIYIELSRANIESGSTITLTDGINAAGTAGRRIRASNTLPRISDLNNGNPEDTLAIPLVYKNSTNIWWIPSGMLWQNGTVSEIGATTRAVNVPLGTIVGIHIEGDTDQAVAITQSYLNTNMPGWWLCNAATQPLINYVGSTLNGKPTPALNNPVAISPRDQGTFIRGAKKSFAYGGSDQVVLAYNHLPQHYHNLNSINHQNHLHNLQNTNNAQVYLNEDHTGSWSSYRASSADGFDQGYYTTGTASHSHTLTADTVNSQPHENVPQSISLVYIMKVL